MVDSPIVDLSVYFIADPWLCQRRRVEEVVDLAILGGATFIQYRDKLADKELAYHTACLVRDVAFDHSIPFVVNDHVDIAHDIFADGVHLGQDDSDPVAAREKLGSSAIIGVTAFTEEHLKAIDPDVVDYVGIGPFFETQTDKGKLVLGAERFAQLVELSPVPVVGVGGITPENCEQVINAGAHGVAMMRAISEADQPNLAAQAFVKSLADARAGSFTL